MKRIAIAVGVLAAAVLLYFLLWPVPIDAVAWEPALDPGFTGPFAPNDALAGAEHLIDFGSGLEGVVDPGPEDVTKGPDGLMYAGLGDGLIVRFDPEGGAPADDFAHTRGRPLRFGER